MAWAISKEALKGQLIGFLSMGWRYPPQLHFPFKSSPFPRPQQGVGGGVKVEFSRALLPRPLQAGEREESLRK